MSFTLRHVDSRDSSTKAKFLGVLIDPKLTWKDHTTHVRQSTCKNIFALRSLCNKLNSKYLLTAYYGLIHSKMTYVLLVWGHTAHLGHILSLQRRAIRLIAGLGYRDECRKASVDLGILTLPCCYILQCVLAICENSTSYAFKNQIHGYNTRGSSDYFIEFHRVARSRNGLNYYGPKLFNVLPNVIKRLPLRSFKLKIKSFLLSHAFYSIEEYLKSKMCASLP
nr:unnamed protein product [Callosobruchus analis]